MKNESLTDYLKKNSMPILLQILSLFALIANLWLANKLAPMAKDLAVAVNRVEANENLDLSQHPTFVTHQELKDSVVDRLDRIQRDILTPMQQDIKTLLRQR